MRVDTKVYLKLAYLFFILMQIRDYGHFKSLGAFAPLVPFYLRFIFPWQFHIAPKDDVARDIVFEVASPAKY